MVASCLRASSFLGARDGLHGSRHLQLALLGTRDGLHGSRHLQLALLGARDGLHGSRRLQCGRTYIAGVFMRLLARDLLTPA